MARKRVTSVTLGDGDRALLGAIATSEDRSRSQVVRRMIHKEANERGITMAEYDSPVESPAEPAAETTQKFEGASVGGKGGFPDTAAGQGGPSDQGAGAKALDVFPLQGNPTGAGSEQVRKDQEH